MLLLPKHSAFVAPSGELLLNMSVSCYVPKSFFLNSVERALVDYNVTNRICIVQLGQSLIKQHRDSPGVLYSTAVLFYRQTFNLPTRTTVASRQK